MKIYISGKITGELNYKEKLDAAEKRLKRIGHVVLNPTIIPPVLTYDEHMKIDLAMVDASDALFMLKGWTSSKGAQIERNYAIEKNKHIFYEEDYI